MSITAICSNWACLHIEINCNRGSYMGKRQSKGVRRAERTFGVSEMNGQTFRHQCLVAVKSRLRKSKVWSCLPATNYESVPASPGFLLCPCVQQDIGTTFTQGILVGNSGSRIQQRVAADQPKNPWSQGQTFLGLW